jgi:stringent starvation protein B
MSEISTKPYLLRAIYEWCTDNGYTPYLAAMVDAKTRVPREFVKNGEIVLNISFTATSGLKLDNDFVQFNPRRRLRTKSLCPRLRRFRHRRMKRHLHRPSRTIILNHQKKVAVLH